MLVQNTALFHAIQDVRTEFRIEAFRSGEDPCGAAFLSRFPFAILRCGDEPKANTHCKALIDAAFEPAFKDEVERTIAICYTDHGGGTIQDYFIDLVEDFLNFALPRTIGLPDEDSLFERYYLELERDLLGPDLSVTVQAVLGNVSCHSGFDARRCSAVGLENFWRWEHASAVNTHYLRQHVVPAIEIRKAAHPIATGRNISDDAGFVVLERPERHPKSVMTTVDYAYGRSEEVTRKAVLALRLLTGADAYSDYRGFRMLGHLSPFCMNLMNWPDEHLSGGRYANTGGFESGLEKLLISLFNKPKNCLAVLDHRLGDALRRQRRGVANPDVDLKNAIDQLFDYVQAFESLLPNLRGSDTFCLSAGILLARCTSEAGADVVKFFKSVYHIRDEVMHGRLDGIIQEVRNKKCAIEIGKLAGYVRTLGSLAILNDGLPAIARRIALGETIKLNTPFN